MSKVWKWILGIVIVLVVLGAAAGVFLLVRSHPMLTFGPRYGFRSNVPNGQNVPSAPNQPTTPNGQGAPNRPNTPGWYGPGMRGYGPMGPMMGERGFRPYERGFSPFGMFMPFGTGFFLLVALLRLVVPIGILVLVAFVFYQLGKRSGMPSPVAPQAPPALAAPDEDKPKNRGRRS